MSPKSISLPLRPWRLMTPAWNWYELELPVLTQLFMDAALFVQDQVDQFDVIIVDSSDPVGRCYDSRPFQVLPKVCTPTPFILP